MTTATERNRTLAALEDRVVDLERDPRDFARSAPMGRRIFSVGFVGPLWVLGGRVLNGSEFFDDVFTGRSDKWAVKTGAAAFGERAGHASAVFRERMWVIGGGTLGGELKNDIWWSVNGKKWHKVAGESPFEAREGHTLTVHNGRLFLIGGFRDNLENPYLNDVWSSSNGESWFRVTSSADFRVRRDHTCLSFRGQLWVIGGIDRTRLGSSLEDVWSSPNGETWTEATSSAAWAERQQFASVVFSGRMWVVGGARFDFSQTPPEENLTDAWWSTNGRDWTQKSNDGFDGVSFHELVVYNNFMWLIGGVFRFDLLGFSSRKVYRTANGGTWERTEDLPAPRMDHTALVFPAEPLVQGRSIWVLGGLPRVEGSAYVGVPAPWVDKTKTPSFEARFGHASMVFDGKMWVIGGFEKTVGAVNIGWVTVWSTSNGIDWAQEADLPTDTLSDIRGVVFLGQMFILGNGLVYSSSDGDIWTLLAEDISIGGRHQVVVFDDKMWVLGGSGDGTTLVQSSPDGIDWTVEAPLPAALSNHASVVFLGKIWVIGGFEAIAAQKTVYSTVDGVTWIQEADFPIVIVDHTVVVAEGKLWVLGGRSLTGIQKSVRSTVDGVTWIQENSFITPQYLHTSLVFPE